MKTSAQSSGVLQTINNKSNNEWSSKPMLFTGTERCGTCYVDVQEQWCTPGYEVWEEEHSNGLWVKFEWRTWRRLCRGRLCKGGSEESGSYWLRQSCISAAWHKGISNQSVSECMGACLTRVLFPCSRHVVSVLSSWWKRLFLGLVNGTVECMREASQICSTIWLLCKFDVHLINVIFGLYKYLEHALVIVSQACCTGCWRICAHLSSSFVSSGARIKSDKG